MAIDTSIYNNIKQFETPSYADAQSKAMNLSQMAMQNQNMSNQISKEQLQQQQAEKSRLNKTAILTFEKLKGMSPEDQAKSYDTDMKKLAGMGMPTDNLIKDQNGNFVHDPQLVAMQMKGVQSLPEYKDYENEQLDLNIKRADLASSKNDPIDRNLSRQKTKAEIAKLYSESNKERGINGKPLAAEQADRLAGHDSSIKMIGDLRETLKVNKDNFGPVVGRFNSINPYSTSGQNVSAMFEKAAQVIGKALEGGKLAEGDIKRYRSMLPSQSDTPEVANEKLNQVERLVANQRNSELETYGKAGSNVENFAQTVPRDIGVIKPKKQGAELIPSANAQAITSQDAEAIHWARKNKNDPDAQKILQIHGEK